MTGHLEITSMLFHSDSWIIIYFKALNQTISSKGDNVTLVRMV